MREILRAFTTPRSGNAVGAAACAAMMGFALFVQHGLGLEPCSMCVLQRVATISLGVVFLIAAVHAARGWGRYVYAALTTLIAAAGMSVSIRQLWIMAQPKGAVEACGAGVWDLLGILPLHEALALVFKGGGDCQDDSFTLLGLPLPAGVLLCLAALAAWSLYVNVFANRGGGRA